MLGSAYNRLGAKSGSSAPSHFKDLARSAIYQELPLVINSSSVASVRSAPTHLHGHKKLFSQHSSSYRSLASSVFSSSKRSVRSAPLMYSNSSATIPEDSEPITTTVEQLINDIQLHETAAKDSVYHELRRYGQADGSVSLDDVDADYWQISLGSMLQYQNVPESLVDWNLNVTRCKLMLIHLPTVSSVPDFRYTGAMPQLVGELAYSCHINLISPNISDKELIYNLVSSNLYQEHNLDAKFKKSVAEISVKQSRLLQINCKKLFSKPIPTSIDNQVNLRVEFKEIALRNYLINLAAAATTAYEYKIKSDEFKRMISASSGVSIDGTTKKTKIPKVEKKRLWESVRLDVFKRAGLEE